MLLERSRRRTHSTKKRTVNCRQTAVAALTEAVDCLRQCRVGTWAVEIQTAVLDVPKVHGLRPSTRDASTPLQVPERDSIDTYSTAEHLMTASASSLTA